MSSDIEEILSAFKADGAEWLLFLNNVKEMEVWKWESDANAPVLDWHVKASREVSCFSIDNLKQTPFTNSSHLTTSFHNLSINIILSFSSPLLMKIENVRNFYRTEEWKWHCYMGNCSGKGYQWRSAQLLQGKLLSICA